MRRSINHENLRYYDAWNQGDSSQADSKATAQNSIDQADSKVYNQTNSSVNARIDALNQEVENEQQNVNNVASLVRIKCVNQRLAGKKHPVTGVPFIECVVTINGQRCVFVVPRFESTFTAQLPKSERYASDKKHKLLSNLQLREAIKNNLSLRAKFTEEQVQQISKGITPEGYTWHHDVEMGRMQLVDSEVHRKTGHTGGRKIWGGGRKRRRKKSNKKQ